MKNKLSIIAVLFALILAGCTKENIETEAEPKMVTVSVTMTSPEDDAATRVSLTPDSGTPQGLILKWETTDKLMLCFEYNANYYHVDATIVPGSISANGKSANFTFAVPEQIPSGVTFNLYVVYQKTNGIDTDGGYFRPNTKIYDLEQHESFCVTLNQLNPTSQRGISRPMLYFEKTNITNTENPNIGPINLIHAGWIMAIHFKNNTDDEIYLPTRFEIAALGLGNVDWVYNGNYYDPDTANPYTNPETTSFNFSGHTFSTSYTGNLNYLFLLINEDGAPLYGNQLAAGASTVFYRWIASKTKIPTLLTGGVGFNNGELGIDFLSGRTVTFGKVYHIYSIWNGNEDFAFSGPY